MYNNIVKRLYKSFSETIQLREELDLMERKLVAGKHIRNVEYKGKLYDSYQVDVLSKLDHFLASSHMFNENRNNDLGYFSCLDNPNISHIAMSFLASVIESGVDITAIDEPEKYNLEQLPALCALLSVGLPIEDVCYATLAGERMIARATGDPWAVDSKERVMALDDNEWKEKLRHLDAFQELELLNMRKYADKDGYYAVYQIREDRHDFLFEGYEDAVRAGAHVSEMCYDVCYTDRIVENSSTNALLESIYAKLNADYLPSNYFGHSLSVSDVIVLNHDGKREAYYCDKTGFVKVDDFLLDVQPQVSRKHFVTIPADMDEAVVANKDMFISIHEFSEGGYEYTIYDKYSREIDGGVYDNDSVTMTEALDDIIDSEFTDKDFSLLPFPDVFLENAERTNASISEFESKTQKLYNEDGLQMSYDELKNVIDEYILNRLEDIPYKDFYVYHPPVLVGSRSRGLENPDSDIDVLLAYDADVKEDEVFNFFHNEDYYISEKKVDINPIRPQETGTLEEYLIGADAYLEHKKAEIYTKEAAVKDDVRIMYLTGEPVSQDMLSILERCKNGALVDIEEIEATKEIKTARSCVLHEIPTIERKDREAVTEHVLSEMMKFGSANVDKDGNTQYNGIVRKGNRLDIVLGLPASGKSSTIVSDISRIYQSKLIDCDEAKKLLPEFNRGWGSNVVHRESQRIELKTFRRALRSGENIVLPKVGGNAQKLMNTYIALAKDAGYKVHIHYVELNRNVALGRMLERFLDDGRFLDPNLIDKYDNPVLGNSVEDTYEHLKQSQLLDGYTKWNNDVPLGSKPILLEQYNMEDFLNKRESIQRDNNNISGSKRRR